MKKALFLLYAVFFFTALNGQASFCEICSNGLDDDGNGLIDCDDPVCACSAQDTVTVCYIPDARCSANCGYTLDGAYMNSSGALKLRHLPNFGPGGVVDCTMNLVPVEGTLTVGSIQAAGCDIFFVGGFGGVTCTGVEANQIPAAELAAVRAWSIGNDKHLAIVTQVNADVWGFTADDGNVNPDKPTAAGLNSPVFNGPFGTVNSFIQGGCFQGYFTGTPATGVQILATDASPVPKATIAIDLATNDIMTGDVDIFTSFGGVSGGPDVTTKNDILFANIFALACLSVHPEICNNGVDDDGDGLTDADDPECTLGNITFIHSTLCEGESYEVDGVGYDSTGVYEIVLTGGSFLGCDSVVVLDLTVHEAPVTAITAQICAGETYTLQGTAYAATGIYQIFFPGGASSGCDSTVLLDLRVHETPVTTFTAQLCDGEAYAVGGVDYAAGGHYEIVLPGGSSFGCDSIVLLSVELCLKMFVPNVFSPNGDGANDEITIFTSSAIEMIETFAVFDRWGQEVFSRKGFPPNVLKLGWDGTFRGKNLEAGVYAYYIEARSYDGSIHRVKGDITLIR